VKVRKCICLTNGGYFNILHSYCLNPFFFVPSGIMDNNEQELDSIVLFMVRLLLLDFF